MDLNNCCCKCNTHPTDVFPMDDTVKRRSMSRDEALKDICEHLDKMLKEIEMSTSKRLANGDISALTLTMPELELNYMVISAFVKSYIGRPCRDCRHRHNQYTGGEDMPCAECGSIAKYRYFENDPVDRGMQEKFDGCSTCIFNGRSDHEYPCDVCINEKFYKQGC